MSMCIQHTVGFMEVSCADPGIFARREGGPKKTLITFFRHQFYRGISMVYFKENYIFLRFQRASNILQGRGSNFFQRGGGANVNIELVNFQGGGSEPLGPRMRMIDSLASSVKPIPKDRFSHAMTYFSLHERLV